MSTETKTALHGKPVLVPVKYFVRQRGPATIALGREELLANTAQQLLTILRGDSK